MYSEPYVIGTKAADANGGVSFTWTLPATTEPGEHRVVLVGEQSGTAERAFTVDADGSTAKPDPAKPDPAGSLSKTGTSVPGAIAIIGLISLVAGGVVTAAARRRRQVIG